MSCGPKQRPIWDEYKSVGSGRGKKAKCKHCNKDPFSRNIDYMYAHLLDAHPIICDKYKTDGTLKRVSLKRGLNDISNYLVPKLPTADKEAADTILALWSSVCAVAPNAILHPLFREYSKILTWSYSVPGKNRFPKLVKENKDKIKTAVHAVAASAKQGPVTIDKSSDQCKDGIAHFVVFVKGVPLLLQQYRYF